VEFSLFGNTFDCQHFCAIQLNCKGSTAFEALTVDYYGTGSTLAGVAADMGSGQAQFITQKVNQ
jgi:hypothetical protein